MATALEPSMRSHQCYLAREQYPNSSRKIIPDLKHTLSGHIRLHNIWLLEYDKVQKYFAQLKK
jgi:hypothetical protein